MGRIQCLPPIFWTVVNVDNEGRLVTKSLYEKGIHLFYYEEETKTNKVTTIAKVASPEAYNTAIEAVERAKAKGIFAFACGPIPLNNNQYGVFAFSPVGKGKDYTETRTPWVCNAIGKARQSVLNVQTIVPVKTVAPKTTVQTIKREEKIVDPVRMVVKVRFKYGQSADFTFICNAAHCEGDFVHVKVLNSFGIEERKNVQVGWFGTMRQSELDALAKKLHRKAISELTNEQAVDIPEYWEEWRNSIPKEEPEYVEDYVEDTEAFEAMKDAYGPRADIVYHGDIPDEAWIPE